MEFVFDWPEVPRSNARLIRASMVKIHPTDVIYPSTSNPDNSMCLADSSLLPDLTVPLTDDVTKEDPTITLDLDLGTERRSAGNAIRTPLPATTSPHHSSFPMISWWIQRVSFGVLQTGGDTSVLFLLLKFSFVILECVVYYGEVFSWQLQTSSFEFLETLRDCLADQFQIQGRLRLVSSRELTLDSDQYGS